MQSLSYLNQGGVAANKASALAINLSAARGLYEVLKSNLGPKGTLKMLVGGAGQIKLTKDGNVLLTEMQIQHPTAIMIARAATANDDITGDGTTSTVLLIGELLRQCERFLQEGMHPRILTEGIDIARQAATEFIKEFSVEVFLKESSKTREIMHHVALTSLGTKIGKAFAQQLSVALVDAVETIREEGGEIDLNMIEIMHMKHRMATDTSFIHGLVLDHGARHEAMPKRVEDTYILICNVSLEYENSELGANFYYDDPLKKETLAKAERKVVDDRVQQIIDLKRKCGKNLVVINQKGIDPPSLDMLAGENILALRRAKRRNMERLVRACGGEAISGLDNLTTDVLGYAGLVHEQTLGEEKYTFVEDVRSCRSGTLLVKGPNNHTIEQVKDALRDGLRSLKNTLEDESLIPGAGAFEIACHHHLTKLADNVHGKKKIGVRAFADALLVIPKVLAENSGLDAQGSLIELQSAHARDFETNEKSTYVGLDVNSGNIINPTEAGIWDNVAVKGALVNAAAVITSQLLLVDEIMKAGRRGASQ